MTFVNAGLALAGVIAVAVPIIIHLLSRRRRKPVEWAAMRFLLEAYRRHRRRLQIEQLILLAVRCLILLVLGAALARPVLEATGAIGGGEQRTVYFVIDNGLASGLEGDDGEPVLSRSIDTAGAIVEALRPGDAVGLITAARPARGVVVPGSTDLAAVTRALQALEPSDAATDLPAAVSLLRQAVERTEDDQNVVAYLLSDFRAGSAALERPLPTIAGEDGRDRLTLVALPPAETPAANVRIEAVEPVRHVVLPGAGDGSGRVRVRLARGGAALEREVTRVSLSGEGLAVSEPQVVQWQPGQSQAEADFMLDFAEAADRDIVLTASIDADRLAADNRRHAVLSLRQRLRIILAGQREFGVGVDLDQFTAGQWLRRALEPLEGGPLEVVSVEAAALEPTDIRGGDVLVVARPDLLTDRAWQAVDAFIERGGLLLITPPSEANIHQWTDRLSRDLDLPWRISLETVLHDPPMPLASEQPASRLLRLISGELPDLVTPVVVSRTLPVVTDETQATTVLRFADGSPAVIAGSPRTPAPAGRVDAQAAEATADEPAGADAEEAAAATARAAGLVVYFAVAPQLDWTNLPAKPLMLPLVHEIVRQGLSSIRGGRDIVVGSQPSLTWSGSASVLIDAEDERLPLDDAGRPLEPLPHAGAYRIADAADQDLGVLVANIEPAAGRTDVQPPEAVQQWLSTSGPWRFVDRQQPAAPLHAGRSGSPIARWLLAALLALVIVEAALARWFSHARAQAGEVRGGRLVGGIRPTVAEAGGAA